MTGLFAGAFIGGMMGSPHCLGMCGPFAAAASDSPAGYHVGRLTTYAVLGALAGGFGAILPGPGWVSAAVSIALLLWFSGRLAGIVPETHIRIPGLTEAAAKLLQKRGFSGRFLLGAASGLLPCGLLWAGLGIAVSSEHPLVGAAIAVTFGLGTVPLLAGLSAGFQAFARRGRVWRYTLAGAVLLAGLWSVTTRVAADANAEGEAPACHDTP